MTEVIICFFFFNLSRRFCLNEKKYNFLSTLHHRPMATKDSEREDIF